MNEDRVEEYKKIIDFKMQNFVYRIQSDTANYRCFTLATDILLSQEAKRVRGLIPLLIADSLSFDIEENIKYGVLVEFVHFISLLHDDVLDNDSFRRGKPTLNNCFSDSIAVLIGDYFISEVIEYVNYGPYGASVVGKTLQAVKEMVTGVVMEKEMELWRPSQDSYRQMAMMKTGSLFGLSFGLPFIGTDQFHQAWQCGRDFGYLFQVFDDYMDLERDDANYNIYHILPREEIDRMCQDQFQSLMTVCENIGIEQATSEVVRYIQPQGYFRNLL